MERIYSVYKHTNKVNGKVYIGITCNKPEVRWGKNGIGYKRQLFWNAIQKYGWDNFAHEILFENLSESQAYQKEIELIALYDSTNREKGYNVALGGVDGRTIPLKKAVYQYSYRGEFVRHYESTMEVERVNGFNCNAIGMCCRSGVKHISYGYRWSYQYLGDTIPLNNLEAEWRKFIWCYDIDGNFIKQYFSAIEAQKDTGISNSAITGCCAGKYTNTKGLRWYYEFKGDKIEPMSHKIGTDGRIVCLEKTQKQEAAKIKAQSSSQTIPVYQYDKFGNFIGEYRSVQDAVNQGFSDKNKIMRACRESRKTDGFYWDFNKYDIKKDIHVNKNQHRNRYLQYDLDGNFIAEYSCPQEAMLALGLKCISFTNKTSGGFVWKVIPLKNKEEESA